MDDPGHQAKRRIAAERVCLDEDFERARAALMGVLRARRIEADRAFSRGVVEDVVTRHVHDLASGSMNRRMSHGQAMRSVCGCSRVTHFTDPSRSRRLDASDLAAALAD